MFLRITKQRSKDGTEVQYLALAESVRVPGKQHPQTRIIHNFGRADAKKKATIERLKVSLQNYLDSNK